MTLPATTHTADTLAEYLWLELGDIATLLGWEHAGYPQIWQAAAGDTPRLLGLDSLAEASDPAQVERVGAVAVWRRAVKSLASRYDFALPNGRRYDRSQVFKQAQAALALAEEAAGADLGTYALRVDTVVSPSGDPYTLFDDEWRRLP